MRVLRTIYGQLRKVQIAPSARKRRQKKKRDRIFGPQNYEPEGREFGSPRAHHPSFLRRRTNQLRKHQPVSWMRNASASANVCGIRLRNRERRHYGRYRESRKARQDFVAIGFSVEPFRSVRRIPSLQCGGLSTLR